MQIKNLDAYYLLVLIILVGIFALALFLPFWSAILVASVFAILFYPLYTRILNSVSSKKSQRSAVASALTCLLVFLVIIVPFLFIGSLLAGQVQSFLTSATAQNGSVQMFVVDLSHEVPDTLAMLNDNGLLTEDQLKQFAERGGEFLLLLVQKTYTGAVAFFLWILVFFFTLFYLFMDGHRFLAKVKEISPLPDTQDEYLFKEFASMSRATIRGTILLGIIQGSIMGAAYVAAGLDGWVILSVLSIFFAILPVVGTVVVWLPVVVVLLITGNIVGALIVLVVGVLNMGVDNILRPRLVGRDIQIHPLLIFFATLGGIVVFGVIGFLIGPIIMALFQALVNIYTREFKGQLKKLNR